VLPLRTPCRHQTYSSLCTVGNAHSDFVKALLFIPELSLLVSGGSDKDIRLHDLSSLPDWDLSSTSNAAPRFVASLRDHSRPVECLKYIQNGRGEVVLCSADTMGKCCLWQLGKNEKARKLVDWREHETAIYDLVLELRGIWTGPFLVCMC
jgi:WD40 repeat protein